MRFEPLALGREVGPGAGAVEETAAHRLFQGRDPGRDGRLGDPKPLGSAVEAAGFGQVEESVEEVDLHVGPLRMVADPGGASPPGPPEDICAKMTGVIGFVDQ